MEHVTVRRRVGVLAPAFFVFTVPVCLLSIVNATWASVSALVLSTAAVAAGAWWAMPGVRSVRRGLAAGAAVLVAAALAWLALFVVWPAMIGVDGLVREWAIPAFVVVPLGVLVAGGATASIMGRAPGATLVWPWWLGALVAGLVAYPMSLWFARVMDVDALAAIVIFFIPAYALALWTGAAGAVFVAGLPKRAERSPAALVEASPSTEVTAT
jgi:hypothetical protein